MLGGEPSPRTPMGDSALEYDFDWLVIGSGFGGSVSALRMTEKGHSVGVLECGRRFTDAELPSSTRDLRRYFYNPMLGMKGIFRMTTFRDVAVVSGCGVGGGSLVYANTLYVPPRTFFEAKEWRRLQDWEAALARHYAEAKRMLTEALERYDDPGGLFYNLACAEAQLGETDAALEHLRAAVRERPSLAADAGGDSDLAPIRDDPRFAEIVAAP